MPELTFSLSRYDGPATVNGVQFAEVHLSEHADSDGERIRKGWEGTAEVARSQAPEVTPSWASIDGLVEVRLPEGHSGQAFIMGLSLEDGRFWELELTGVGPAPWASEQR